MKKAILSALLAGSAVIASCNKEATTTKPTPTRFISYEMAGSTMYTRAPSSNEVLSIISEALPEHVATVFSGTKTLVVNTGEYTQIPSDTYQVSGTFLGEQYCPQTAEACRSNLPSESIRRSPSMTRIHSTPSQGLTSASPLFGTLQSWTGLRSTMPTAKPTKCHISRRVTRGSCSYRAILKQTISP